MEVKELITIINKERIMKQEQVKILKESISPNYLLALLDITTIENKEDFIHTLDKILGELEDLQLRIIKRNNKEVDEGQ